MKPACKLSGTDGNAFSIIATVSRCLKQNGWLDRARQWNAAAVKCESYEALILLAADYVEVE